MSRHFAEIDGQTIAYQKTGTGKPLLILHGWGSSSDVMMPVARQLEDIRTSYLPDFPGFGESPEPARAWNVGNYTEVTAAFIKEIITEKKTDLLVHSYGARVALKLLSDPQAAQKIDQVIFTGAAGLQPKRSAAYYIKKYTAKTLKLPFLILPGGLRQKGLNQLRKTALWKKLGSSDYQKLSGVMRETFVKSVTEHLDGLLPSISHEILLIWGENDTATPLDQAGRMDRALQNSALVVMDGCGHYAFLDKPKQFIAIARAYLEPDSKKAAL